tara:strand:- start:1851 stop:2285 length:435 start_codon:yes stop_codon:yes gene_type:complete
MFANLPDEIIYRIVNKLDSMEIYYLTLTSKHLNKMNFQAILTALMFKTHFDVDRNELIEYKNTGYTLSDYLSDLNDINSYKFNYETKKSIYLEEKIMYRFNIKQDNLFEKKNLMNVKIHSTYRIPYNVYKILKLRKSPILALIY